MFHSVRFQSVRFQSCYVSENPVMLKTDVMFQCVSECQILFKSVKLCCSDMSHFRGSCFGYEFQSVMYQSVMLYFRESCGCHSVFQSLYCVLVSVM